MQGTRHTTYVGRKNFAWKLAPHIVAMQKIFHTDAIEAMRGLETGSVDLILTDPPYGLQPHAKARGGERWALSFRKNSINNSDWDNLTDTDFASLMNDFMAESFRVLKKSGAMVTFCSTQKTADVLTSAEKAGLYFKTFGVWHKTNPLPRNMKIDFLHSVEMRGYFLKNTKTGTFNGEGKPVHDLVSFPVAMGKERKAGGGHIAQKPVKLMEHFVRLLSNPGEVVLDPFMGTGTSGVAALRLGRSFIGVEKDAKYFDIAKTRLEEI